MKRHLAARLLVLITGLALASPKGTAQLLPVSEHPTSDGVVSSEPSSRLRQDPIVAYTPPTQKDKLKVFAFDSFGPYAFAYASLSGGIEQAGNSPSEWGGGMRGFGTRVASNLGIQLVTTTTRYGMAEVFHEDAAYYRCQCSGFLPRFGHALISTLVGRHGTDGHTTFSVPGLVSPYAGGMAALAWYPDRFGVKDGFRMGNYNLLSQTAGNLALEFIYGGPHTAFSRLRRAKSQGGTGGNPHP